MEGEGGELIKLEFENWNSLSKNSEGSRQSKIEDFVLEECIRIYKKNPNAAIPTKHFKDNQKEIFGCVRNNRQPRLNKAMHYLANAKLVELMQRGGKNYIRWIPVEKRNTK